MPLILIILLVCDVIFDNIVLVLVFVHADSGVTPAIIIIILLSTDWCTLSLLIMRAVNIDDILGVRCYC